MSLPCNNLIVDDAIITVDEAVELAIDLAVERFPDIQDYILRDFVSLLTYMAGERREISLTELHDTIDNFSRALAEGDARLLAQPRGIRVRRVVDVQEFAESKFYMGQRGHVRPRIMEELWRLFHGEFHEDRLEVVLGGGIGWGKSFMAEMGIGYMLYRLSCYHSPQIEFGLAPGSSMYFIMQSIKLELAQKVLFGQFGQMIRRSEYFSRYFPFDTRMSSELRFPNAITIMPLSSSDTSALGLNVFGGILDELNFMSRILKPSSSRYTGDTEYDQAEKLHAAIIRRMKSRFQVRGRVPGKLFLISSANYPDDFIDRRIKEAERDAAETGRSNIFVVRMAQWESLPEDRLSGEKFLVEVGDSTRSSRIIDSMEEAVEPDAVISIPLDYLSDFRRDLEAAIRDLAGIPIGGAGAFIRNRESIESAGVSHEKLFDGKQLFKHPAVELSRFEGNLSSLIDRSYFDYLININENFFIHIDLALSNDSGGVGIGRFGGYKDVGMSFNWDAESGKYIQVPAGLQPSVIVDGILEILPPRVDEININTIGDLIELLNSRICIEVLTADSFQSAALLQRVRRFRNLSGKYIRSGILSIDRTIIPYAELKQALRDGRLIYPNVPKLKKELRELSLDERTKHIDHPVGGSKDLSDCVGGVTYTVTSRYANKDLRKSLSRKLLAGIDSKQEDSPEQPAELPPSVNQPQLSRRRVSMRVH
ncbi:MAG: hypothetical protein LBQ51_02300 [Desulfovibrio sp.]|jgi:hypothetical protein|nr:hypothetical protein [Desulfovibrio sp.]